MKLRGLIFDFDGTLIDTLPIVYRAFRHCFNTYAGREYTDREIDALFGPTEEGVIKQVVPEQWENCVLDYVNEYRRLHLSLQPFPGIEQALALLLDRGVRLAIVTGKGAGSLKVSLELTDLGRYFDIAETGFGDCADKPRSIEKVRKRWGFQAEEIGYVGDAAYDMEAARAAGVIPLGAVWSATVDAAKVEAMLPMALFSSVEQFIRWIETEVEVLTD